jgi:chromate transporter
LVMVVGLFMIVSQPLQNLLGEFSKVSLTLFGGGYVMIKALHDLVVMDLNWISSNEFNQAIAFGQLTPGPILVSATYIGFKVAGLWGALIATIGIFLPASLLMLLAAHGFKKLPDNIWVNAVLMGIRPVIVSFIVFSALIILKPVGFNDQTVVLTILSFVLIEYVKINFLWLMLISGLISLFFL